MKGYIIYLKTREGDDIQLCGYQAIKEAQEFLDTLNNPENLSIREGDLFKVVEITDGKREDFGYPTSLASAKAEMKECYEMKERLNLVTEYEVVLA